MSTHLPSHRTARAGAQQPSVSARADTRCQPCSGTGKRHSIFDFCNCDPQCVANGGQGICGACNGSGSTPIRTFEIRPYTYTDRGVASLGYELVDDAGARVGIFDDVPAARRASDLRGAAVRLSWDPA